jgi:hypothetical protein
MKYVIATTHRRPHLLHYYCVQLKFERRVRLFVLFLKLSFKYHKFFFPLLESFFTFLELFFFFFEFGASHVGMHLLDANIKFSRL